MRVGAVAHASAGAEVNWRREGKHGGDYHDPGRPHRHCLYRHNETSRWMYLLHGQGETQCGARGIEGRWRRHGRAEESHEGGAPNGMRASVGREKTGYEMVGEGRVLGGTFLSL